MTDGGRRYAKVLMEHLCLTQSSYTHFYQCLMMDTVLQVVGQLAVERSGHRELHVSISRVIAVQCEGIVACELRKTLQNLSNAQ